MKKYKLIQTYPGCSVKIGTEVFKNGNHYQSNFAINHCVDHFHQPLHIVENQPKFWQEIVEKDYEILEYKSNCGSICKTPFLKDSYQFYIDQKFNIHSIKRLSDGEIFTIGDLTISKNDSTPCPIKAFEIEKNFMKVYYSEDTEEGEFNYLNKIIKVQSKPLFTTEDDVDIFKGDKFYYVKFKKNRYSLGKVFEVVTCDRPSCIYEPQYEKYFSTKEKAEEYVLMNKPLLTLKDVEELLCKNTSSYFLEKFKKRAQKLNNKN